MKFTAYSGRDLHAVKAVLVSARNESLTLEQALAELETFMAPKEELKTFPVPDEVRKANACPACGHPVFIKRRGSDLPYEHPDQEFMKDCVKCGHSIYIGKVK